MKVWVVTAIFPFKYEGSNYHHLSVCSTKEIACQLAAYYIDSLHMSVVYVHENNLVSYFLTDKFVLIEIREDEVLD